MAGHSRDLPRGRSLRQNTLILACIGFFMGVADIIPGVSGGTVAFIAGIYEQLLGAIASFNHVFASRLLRLDVRGALEQVRIRFLLPLGLGILTAIMLMSRLIHWLLNDYRVHLLALFLGLISGSILLIVRRLPPWSRRNAAFLLAGFIIAFIMTGLIPVSTPQTYWFIFLSGAVAICAMILPGISGAFILLLLGKYDYITGVLKNPFTADHPLVLLVFAGGCIVGLGLFSRGLKRCLVRAYGPTMYLLLGFMAGAMRKLWPWKEAVATTPDAGTVAVLREHNVLPAWSGLEIPWAVGLFLLGFLAIMALERVGSKVGGPGAVPVASRKSGIT